MVRFDRILEIIEEDDLLDHTKEVGDYLHKRLLHLSETTPSMSNVRGLGLMCAFDLPDTHARNAFLTETFNQGIIMLGCGTRSIRFRPPLTITKQKIDMGVEAIEKALRSAS